MSETYNANGTIPQVTAPLDTDANSAVGLGISSSTNASPIVVTTSSSHGFSSGDTVFIEGHLVNTNANGRWAITVTGASTLRLNGSTGNGVGGATGYVIDYSVNPLITIPDDGDAADASSVNPAFEGIFNTVPFLYERTGRYRLYNTFEASQFTATPGDNLGSSFSVTHDTWTDIPGIVQPPGVGPAPVFADDDILQVEFSCGLSYDVSSLTNFVSLCVGLAYSIDGGSTYIQLRSSIRDLPYFATATTRRATAWTSMFLTGVAVVAPVAYLVKPQLYAATTGGTGNASCQKTSAYAFRINHYRPNA